MLMGGADEATTENAIHHHIRSQKVVDTTPSTFYPTEYVYLQHQVVVPFRPTKYAHNRPPHTTCFLSRPQYYSPKLLTREYAVNKAPMLHAHIYISQETHMFIFNKHCLAPHK